jgi:nucleoside-diphosphate-sugar epimerase
MPQTALVAGATGATAKRLVELLVGAGWTVIGVSRNPPAGQGCLSFVRADLLDLDDSTRALRGCRSITHVFYTGRAKHGEGGVESVAENAAMLRNTLDAIEPAAPDLAHVHLVQGGKYYGAHLGPFPTPAREDDPRHMPPNFYYDQQNILTERQHGRRWTWSASRPEFVFDFAPERARNIISAVGAYAAIAAELGVPLDFPGSRDCFDAIKQATDATLLAKAMIYIATTPACANKAFNVTNGDLFRWNRLWPRLAGYFGLPAGAPRPLKLAQVMADKEAVWQRIVAKHGLKPQPLEAIANWSFADVQFSQDYDVITSTTKLRRAGFNDVVDTEEMFLAHLARYREAGILP